MVKDVEVGDLVTIKAEVTHIRENGGVLIVEIRGAMAPVAVSADEVATVTKPKKWTPPKDKPD